jgi:hypothetical protein
MCSLSGGLSESPKRGLFDDFALGDGVSSMLPISEYRFIRFAGESLLISLRSDSLQQHDLSSFTRKVWVLGCLFLQLEIDCSNSVPSLFSLPSAEVTL